MKTILEIIKPIKLLAFHHADTAQKGSGCAMDVLSYLRGDLEITDSPACVCPIIASLMRSTNDWLNDSDRQKLIPFIFRASGTKTDDVLILESRRKILIDAYVYAYAYVDAYVYAKFSYYADAKVSYYADAKVNYYAYACAYACAKDYAKERVKNLTHEQKIVMAEQFKQIDWVAKRFEVLELLMPEDKVLPTDFYDRAAKLSEIATA